MRTRQLLLALVWMLVSAQAHAAVPMLLNYQGRLTNPGGSPQDGSFTMGFAVYDAETGGVQLPSGTPWSETQSVQVTNGVFNVLLGSVTPLPVDLFTGGPSDSAGPLRFLQVTVSGEILAPRRRIASAAYAISPGSMAGGAPFTNIQSFTANGTWTKPANVSRVYVRVWGGGGGGGVGGGSGSGCGSGGGGGGYAEGLVAVSGNVNVVVGTGGPSGNNNGGTSTFSIVTANGGIGGILLGGTSAGGTASGGDVNISGQQSGAGPSSGGCTGGAGGSSPFGGGPGAQAGSTSVGGGNGGTPGGGGAGGHGFQLGGNGADGLVIVYWAQ